MAAADNTAVALATAVAREEGHAHCGGMIRQPDGTLECRCGNLTLVLVPIDGAP